MMGSGEHRDTELLSYLIEQYALFCGRAEADRQGKSAVDIGAGTGRAGVSLKKMFETVDAVEPVKQYRSMIGASYNNIFHCTA